MLGAREGYARSIDRSPAFVINARTDVVAFNSLAETIYAFDANPEWRFGRNLVWRLFADPSRRALYADSWDRMSAVGIVRANYASRVGDPGFEELLLALHQTGHELVRRWEAHYTAPVSQTLPVAFSHKKLGRIEMYSTRLTLPERPGCALFVLPAADKRTTAVFSRLARLHERVANGVGRAGHERRRSKER